MSNNTAMLLLVIFFVAAAIFEVAQCLPNPNPQTFILDGYDPDDYVSI